jgi:hypothetical protein
VLEIYIEPRRTLNLRQAVLEAIESGEYETLQSDIRDCFNDDQIEEIEEVLESGDIDETIDDIITEWAGDDLDDLIEVIESYFAEASVQLYFEEDEDLVDETEDDLDSFEDDVDDEEVDTEASEEYEDDY